MENNRERSYIPFIATMDILPRFSGEFDSVPIEEWLERASNDAKVYEWSSKELFVACQRALVDSALRFYNSSVKLDSWEKLKAALIEKFRRTTSATSSVEISDKTASTSESSGKTTSSVSSKKSAETTHTPSSINNGKKVMGSISILKDTNNNASSSTAKPKTCQTGYIAVENVNGNSKSKDSKSQEPIYYATLIFLKNEPVMKNSLSFKIAGLAGKARYSNAAQANLMRRDFWRKVQWKTRKAADAAGCLIQDACGNKHKPDGRVRLLTRINGHAYNLEYIILDLAGVMPEEVMLGDPLHDVADVLWGPDKIELIPI